MKGTKFMIHCKRKKERKKEKEKRLVFHHIILLTISNRGFSGVYFIPKFDEKQAALDQFYLDSYARSQDKFDRQHLTAALT
jgi:hypothetical protein